MTETKPSGASNSELIECPQCGSSEHIALFMQETISGPTLDLTQHVCAFCRQCGYEADLENLLSYHSSRLVMVKVIEITKPNGKTRYTDSPGEALEELQISWDENATDEMTVRIMFMPQGQLDDHQEARSK